MWNLVFSTNVGDVIILELLIFYDTLMSFDKLRMDCGLGKGGLHQ